MSKKDMIFKEEMKAFNIEVDDIQPSNDILTLIDAVNYNPTGIV